MTRTLPFYANFAKSIMQIINTIKFIKEEITMERKEYKNEGMEEIKAFVKTYWKEMLFPALGAGIFVGLLTNRSKKGNSSPRVVMKNHLGLQPWAEMVDEDIYTELAPKIEQAVFNSGLEKAVFDRHYELDEVTSKIVTVTVETINGD